MPKGDFILVGDSSRPRGVAVIVNGATIVMGVKAAREIAHTILNVATLVEATGGAAPEIEAIDVKAEDDFVRAQGFHVRARS